MAQYHLITTSTSKRCKLMWNFIEGIPKRLARRVLALTGWEAQASAMYRGSSSTRNINPANGPARASTIHPIVLCLIGIGSFQPVIVVFAAERCVAPAATRVVSVQGNVTWSIVGGAALEPAKLNDLLCAGDTVRVGTKSRAVLRLPNETTIPLDQNTVFQLKQPITDKEPTLIELIQGAIHVITRTPKPFKVNTPYMNAAVEGTEFYVGVDSQEARVAVIEGKVNVSNEQGALLLTDNEAATARKGQAPQKTLTIKPRDAVQWALYYPPLFDPRSRPGSEKLANVHDLYSQGKITDAIESLNAVNETERNGDYYSYRAGLLLLVGRADEAEPDIETALRENQNNTDALSLKAIIAIVRNDKTKALELANQAVSIDDKSAAARIALSYALQANFKIEEALKEARQATERDQNNALAWARVAELELSIPNYDKSKEAAEKAVKLNPNLARTQSVLGFANLTRIDIKAAKESFNKAIELDQADPLPRLGLGLAIIREGKLEEGREQIEIAASLDPENSLVRSYLGKAYYQEKRGPAAEKQFALAKERDPKDPTPHFYEAIRKQTEHRPVEALKSLEEAKELNSNRAVYRSRLLLDEDLAARNVSLARIYSELEFDQLALIEASSSVAADPANHSAHNFLADAYSQIDRREIARASETLQAQLLQPVGLNPLRPRRAFADLRLVDHGNADRLGYNNYSALFEERSPVVDLALVAGTNETLGSEFVMSGHSDRVSFSVAQFHYETDGFRENNDLQHDIFDVFGQYAVTDRLSAQMEFRLRNTEQGDVVLRGDPDVFAPTFRRKIDQEAARLGLNWAASPSANVLVSAMHARSEDTQQFDPDGLLSVASRDKGDKYEAEYLWRSTRINAVAGVGRYSTRQEISNSLFGLSQTIPFRNSYQFLYSNFFGIPSVVFQLGVNHASVEQGDISLRRWNKKLGFTAQPFKPVRVRLATFDIVKPTFSVQQTIEPTQVAGFNQFFDDPNHARARIKAAAVDVRLAERIHFGVESMRRKIEAPALLTETGAIVFDKSRERSLESFVYVSLNRFTTLNVNFRQDHFQSNVDDLKTNILRAKLRFHLSPGFQADVQTTFVHQRSTQESFPDTIRDEDRFGLLDLGLAYGLPKRVGTIGIHVRNVLGEKFRFRDAFARSTEDIPPQFLPERSFELQASFRF